MGEFAAEPTDAPTVAPTDAPTTYPTLPPTMAPIFYSFPRTTRNLVHGMCVSPGATVTTSGIQYTNIGPFGNNIQLFGDATRSNYTTFDVVDFPADGCQGLDYMQPEEALYPLYTTLTVEVDVNAGPVTLCVFAEASYNMRHGGWNDLTSEGFTEATNTFNWGGYSTYCSGYCGITAMKTFCKEFSYN